MRDTFKDAIIAIRDFGWAFEKRGNKQLLMPPLDDERRHWAAIWDADGFPHWLPNFSEENNTHQNHDK